MRGARRDLIVRAGKGGKERVVAIRAALAEAWVTLQSDATENIGRSYFHNSHCQW